MRRERGRFADHIEAGFLGAAGAVAGLSDKHAGDKVMKLVAKIRDLDTASSGNVDEGMRKLMAWSAQKGKACRT